MNEKSESDMPSPTMPRRRGSRSGAAVGTPPSTHCRSGLLRPRVIREWSGARGSHRVRPPDGFAAEAVCFPHGLVECRPTDRRHPSRRPFPSWHRRPPCFFFQALWVVGSFPLSFFSRCRCRCRGLALQDICDIHGLILYLHHILVVPQGILLINRRCRLAWA